MFLFLSSSLNCSCNHTSHWAREEFLLRNNNRLEKQALPLLPCTDSKFLSKLSIETSARHQLFLDDELGPGFASSHSLRAFGLSTKCRCKGNPPQPDDVRWALKFSCFLREHDTWEPPRQRLELNEKHLWGLKLRQTRRFTNKCFRTRFLPTRMLS